MTDRHDLVVLDAPMLRHYAGNYDYSYSASTLLGDVDPRFPHAGDQIRARGCLLTDELHAIARWKSPRRAGLVLDNAPELIQRTTGEALAMKDSDPGYAARLLCSLWGIGVPTATAVLTVVDPQSFGIIDYRVWHVLSLWKPDHFPPKYYNSFSFSDWLNYLDTIRDLARKAKITCREVDMALWQMDREMSKRSQGECSSVP